VAEDSQSGTRSSAAKDVQLRGVLVGKIGHLRGDDRGKRGQFIHQNQVLEGTRRKEKRFTLLQGHGGTELWLVIIVTQVGNLVKVAKVKEKL